MTEIASLLVTIGADISDLKQGLTDTETGIDNLGSRVQSGINTIGGQVVRTGAALTELTAPLRTFGAAGLDVASDFDSVMAEISARTGVVGADLDSVRQFALQMGADTSFSAQQAGDAFLQLLSSGQTTQEAFATLPAVLDAAAASGEDLGHTADVVTDIMASFGIPVQAVNQHVLDMQQAAGVSSEMLKAWGDNAIEATPQIEAWARSVDLSTDELADLVFNSESAQTVVDTLAKAAGASSADMSSLGQGFANVGGVAKAFGLNVEDTAAILAVLSENGIKGAEAGTALKSMLLNMTRPTEEVQGEWSALGLSFYDAAGNARPLEEVISDLDGVLDNLPAQEQNEVMQKLAGSYGITALTALRGSISIDKMRDSMRSQSGATEVAQARMDTFKGRTDSLMGSIETLAIQGLTPLMNDVLTPLIEQTTLVVNGFTDWAVANPQLTSTIVAVGGALAIAGPALIAIGTAITLAAPAVAALGVVFAALTSPIALVVGGLAALAYVASQVIDFGALATNISTGITTALDEANIDLSTLPTKVSDAIAGLDFSTVTIDLTGVQTTVEGAFDDLDFSGVQPIVESHFNDILTAVVSVVGIVFGGPISIGLGIAKLISLAIENDFLGIRTLLDGSGITATVTDAFTNIKATVDGIIQDVFGGGGGTDNGDVVAQFAARTGDSMAAAAGGGQETPLDRFVDKLRLGMDKIGELGTTVWDNIKPGLDAIGAGIQGFITNLSGADTSGLGDLFFNITSVIGGLVGAIAGIVADVGSEVIGGAMEAIGNALPTFGTAIADLISVFSDIGKGDWKEAGIDLVNTITTFVEGIGKLFGLDIQIPDFSTALAGFQTAFDAIPIILDDVKARIERGVNDFASGIRGVFRDIEQTILDIQIKAADIQIALGINYDANVADKNAKEAQLNASNLAENLETGINTGLAAGDITIDPAQYVNVDYAALASKITNPMLIQDALSKAMAEGDQQALDVLLPLATELGIDTQSIVDQFAASLATAGSAQIYNATLTADVLVQAGQVNLGPLRGAINEALRVDALNNSTNNGGSGAGIQPASAVPHLATGGTIKSEGLAYLHAGEVVMNQSQQAAAGGGRGGSIGQVIIQTNDPQKLIFDLKVMGIDLEAMAKPT